ncbi:MAG: hypothetical protein IPQ13_07740 [Holophagaceae bacterium]|nr:hypothetical protein [Holophagaceae bacterium]
MRVLDVIPSLVRRRWFIAACLVPFALLGIWSILLVRSARAAHHELDHCTIWTLETGRHLEAFETLHQRTSPLLSAPSIAREIASVDAASDALIRSREELARRTSGEWDASMAAVDGVVKRYATQVDLFMRSALAWEKAQPGPGKAEALATARVALAHLDHRHQEALGAFRVLDHSHRVRLDASIQASQRNNDQLSFFAAGSLLIALAFWAAGCVALWLKLKGDSAASFAKTLVDTLPMGLLAWGNDGIALEANPGLGRIMGHPTPTFRAGMHVDLLLPPEIRKRIEEADQGERFTFNLTHATGRLLAVEASAGATRSSASMVHLAVFRDISRSTEAERRLVETQRMAAVGGNMVAFCRDLQRSLNPILQSIKMLSLKRDGEESLPGWPTWEQLGCSAMTASDLLRQIVHFANQDLMPEQDTMFDLNACIQEMVVSFQTDGVPLGTLVFELTANPALVTGPREKFRVSLDLLIQRALDATGGEPTVRIRTWGEEEFHCIEIVDSGDAIPASQISRVFEPVYLTSMETPESGFGLFNVAATVHEMGGSICAEKLDGGLTRFLIQIPRGR